MLETVQVTIFRVWQTFWDEVIFLGHCNPVELLKLPSSI